MILSNLASLFATGTMPTPDPLGYPVPTILLQALSYFTLTLHFIALNFTLGGLMLLVWTRLRKKAGHDDAARFLGSGLPLGFSYLVTLGVPPLLFLQVIYGQMFYSSSVIMGAFWILVVPLLIASYGLLYLHKLSRDEKPRPQLLYLVVALAGMLFVGFLYVNNITLSVSPEKWIEMYGANPSGNNLNTTEPTLWPRYLLFMSPAFAVGGLALILVGGLVTGWRSREHGGPISSLGLKSFILGRVFTAAAGAALIATLPEAIQSKVLSGGTETLFLGAGVGLAVVATALGFLSARKGSGKLAIMGLLVMVLEIASLVILRDRVRLEYLTDHFALSDVPVNTQWGMFGIFLVATVLGLLFLIIVTYKVGSKAIEGAKKRWEEEAA